MVSYHNASFHSEEVSTQHNCDGKYSLEATLNEEHACERLNKMQVYLHTRGAISSPAGHKRV